MRKPRIFATVAASLALFSGCSDPEFSKPVDNLEELLDASEILYDGDSISLEVSVNDMRSQLESDLDLVDYIHDQPLDGDKQPILKNGEAIRLRTAFTIRGDSAKLSNDLACDVVKLDVDGDLKDFELGAIAIGDSSSEVFVHRPKNGAFALACFAKDREPSSLVLSLGPRRPR